VKEREFLNTDLIVMQNNAQKYDLVKKPNLELHLKLIKSRLRNSAKYACSAYKFKNTFFYTI